MSTNAWAQLTTLAENGPDIKTLFAENPNRFEEFSASFDGMLLDYSKTSLTPDAMAALLSLAEAARSGRQARRDVLRQRHQHHRKTRRPAHRPPRPRQRPNPRRRPGHHARHPRNVPKALRLRRSRPQRRACRPRTASPSPTSSISASAARTSAPSWSPPALAPYHTGPRIHFVANVDGAHLTDTIRHLNPARTLIIVASKTFSAPSRP